MNILVLTDFSAAATKAFHYARELAIDLNATVFQLHIMSARKKFETEEEKRVAVQNAQKKMSHLANIYPHEHPNPKLLSLPVVNLIKVEKLEQATLEACKEHAIDLIILGTRRKHSLMDYFLGSVSTIIIRKAKVPVIIVPENTTIKAIQHIAIATEDDGTDILLFNFVKTLSKQIKATIERVFVFPLPSDVSTKKEEVYNPTWLEDDFVPEAEVTIVRDLFVVRGLDYFINKHKIDLMALNVPKRKGLSGFFHRSLSQRLVYHSSIPLLIWNEKT